jgi:hypothetical protein
LSAGRVEKSHLATSVLQAQRLSLEKMPGGAMIIDRRTALFPLLTLLLLNAPALCQPAPITWPEAVSNLAAGKTMAEACVALLKRYGSGAQIANGQFTYTKAKSDSDAVVAGLITSLDTGDNAISLPSIQSRLTNSLSGLEQFCDSVKSILPPAPPPGSRGLSDYLSIIKEAIGPILKAATDGVATLYKDHRKDAAIKKKGIQDALNGARWPDFASVKRAE